MFVPSPHPHPCCLLRYPIVPLECANLEENIIRYVRIHACTHPRTRLKHEGPSGLKRGRRADGPAGRADMPARRLRRRTQRDHQRARHRRDVQPCGRRSSIVLYIFTISIYIEYMYLLRALNASDRPRIGEEADPVGAGRATPSHGSGEGLHALTNDASDGRMTAFSRCVKTGGFVSRFGRLV